MFFKTKIIMKNVVFVDIFQDTNDILEKSRNSQIINPTRDIEMRYLFPFERTFKYNLRKMSNKCNFVRSHRTTDRFYTLMT